MALFQLGQIPVENVFAFQFFFLEHKKEDPHVLIALLDPCCLSVRVSIDNGREMFDQAYCVLLVPHHHHHRHHPSILCLSASSSSSLSLSKQIDFSHPDCMIITILCYKFHYWPQQAIELEAHFPTSRPPWDPFAPFLTLDNHTMYKHAIHTLHHTCDDDDHDHGHCDADT